MIAKKQKNISDCLSSKSFESFELFKQTQEEQLNHSSYKKKRLIELLFFYILAIENIDLLLLCFDWKVESIRILNLLDLLHIVHIDEMRTPKLTRSPKAIAIPHYDVAVLGDTACGKSSIIERLISGAFTQTYTPTAAENYMTTLHDGDIRKASLQLFDTAGGFEFPVMLRLTITKCQAFVVVYSIGSRKSLEIAKSQIEEIARVKGQNFPCVLVGNKRDLDLTDEREVSFERGLQTAVQHGCSYIETSAKDNENTLETFQTLVKKIEYTATIKRRIFAEGKGKLFSQQQPKKSGVKLFLNTLSNSFGGSNNSLNEIGID